MREQQQRRRSPKPSGLRSDSPRRRGRLPSDPGASAGLLVVHATGGFFSTNYQYLTSYKGLAFFAKLSAPLELPAGVELVQAQAIWVPG